MSRINEFNAKRMEMLINNQEVSTIHDMVLDTLTERDGMQKKDLIVRVETLVDELLGNKTRDSSISGAVSNSLRSLEECGLVERQGRGIWIKTPINREIPYADKSMLLSEVCDYYNYEIIPKGHYFEVTNYKEGLEESTLKMCTTFKYTTIEEALADWVRTMEMTNRAIYESDGGEYYNTWSKEQMDTAYSCVRD